MKTSLGEAVILDALWHSTGAVANLAPGIFEFVYLPRPDSVLYRLTAYRIWMAIRMRLLSKCSA